MAYHCMEPFHPIESQTSFFKGQELHIQYPNMKGVIYVKEVSNVTILNSQFTYNDPGFIFNDLQVVGFIESLESLHVVRASNIYISDGMDHVHIGNSIFTRNQLYYMSNLNKSDNYLVEFTRSSRPITLRIPFLLSSITTPYRTMKDNKMITYTI